MVNLLKFLRQKQMLTMYKNNSRISSEFKSFSSIKFIRNLKVNCSEIGYYSHTNR